MNSYVRKDVYFSPCTSQPVLPTLYFLPCTSHPVLLTLSMTIFINKMTTNCYSDLDHVEHTEALMGG